MAIQLYRPGTTHEVNGVKCEIGNFDISSMQGLIDIGWFTTTDFNAQDEEPELETEEDINPVRVDAREAGIEGWETKRIKTLQAELDEQKD